LTGRSKYLEFNFLKERLGRILKLITEDFKYDEPKKTPKGLSVMLERASRKSKSQEESRPELKPVQNENK
jgi:hypothetical protein